MTVQPVLEVIGDRLGELATLARGTFDEGRGGGGSDLGRALGGRGDSDGGSVVGRGHGVRGGGVGGGGQGKVGGEGPVALGFDASVAIWGVCVVTSDAGDATVESLALSRDGGLAETVVVLEAGRERSRDLIRRAARAGDARRPIILRSDRQWRVACKGKRRVARKGGARIVTVLPDLRVGLDTGPTSAVLWAVLYGGGELVRREARGRRREGLGLGLTVSKRREAKTVVVERGREARAAELVTVLEGGSDGGQLDARTVGAELAPGVVVVVLLLLLLLLWPGLVGVDGDLWARLFGDWGGGR